MNTTETTSARLGKIARLPFRIRQQLNERLEDNEPSKRLAKWLNSLPEVQEILEALFESRPISEQNLSAWKLGGFRDWQRNQQTRVAARAFLDDAQELEEELYLATDYGDQDRSSMLDRVANRMAFRSCNSSAKPNSAKKARAAPAPCWKPPANWPGCAAAITSGSAPNSPSNAGKTN